MEAFKKLLFPIYKPPSRSTPILSRTPRGRTNRLCRRRDTPRHRSDHDEGQEEHFVHHLEWVTLNGQPEKHVRKTMTDPIRQELAGDLHAVSFGEGVACDYHARPKEISTDEPVLAEAIKLIAHPQLQLFDWPDDWVLDAARCEDHAVEEISLDEVRFALSTLDPTALLLTLNTDGDDAGRRAARSKLVHALLTAQESLTTGELAERAGISRQSIRNHRDDLEAIGLLEIDARGQGKATYYRLRLPFRDERRDRDAPRPLYLPDDEGDGISTFSVRNVVEQLIDARGLLGEAYNDPKIDGYLCEWPPELEPAIDRWPWLRPWIDLIGWLFGWEGAGNSYGPGEWIDGPFELVSQLGTEPATTQAQLV